MATIEGFQKVELRAGTVREARVHPTTRRPAQQLVNKFGTLGTKRSNAQLTTRYRPEELLGRQVSAVTNLAPRKVDGWWSEVLVLGAEANRVILLTPDAPVPESARIA